MTEAEEGYYQNEGLEIWVSAHTRRCTSTSTNLHERILASEPLAKPLPTAQLAISQRQAKVIRFLIPQLHLSSCIVLAGLQGKDEYH
jgi:hypothetical protein